MKRILALAVAVVLVCLSTSAMMPAKAGEKIVSASITTECSNTSVASTTSIGRIVYVQTYANDWQREETWTINQDGTGRTLVSKKERPHNPVILPNGEILVSHDQTEVRKYPGGALLVPLEKLPHQVEAVVAPDGTVAIVGMDKGTTHIYLVRGGNLAYFAKGGSPTWSPDGTKIAYSYEGSIFVRDMAGGEFVLLSGSGYSSSYTSPSWSPDGTHIAANYIGAGKPQTSDIVVVSSGGGNPTTLVSSMFAYSPSWLDNNQIVFSGAIYVWEGESIKTGWSPDLWIVNLQGQKTQITFTSLEAEMWPNAGN